jgi:hypothetical protein
LEHPSLFLSLPFFFGAGFALASLARGIHRALQPVDRVGVRWFAAVVTFVVVSLLVAGIFGLADKWSATLPLPQYWTLLRTPGLTPLHEFGLPDGAFIVGAVSGWWFWTTTESRDRAIFAAGAAGFLVAEALQYDFDLLRRITKFGAGSVSVELSETNQNNKPLSSSQSSHTGGELQSGSPNTQRTDLALETLFRLPSNAVRDELFAKALAAPPAPVGNPGAAYVDVDNQLVNDTLPDARIFIGYGCDRIEHLGLKLAVLQSVHRSELSALAVDPQIVAWLRRAYYDAKPRSNDASVCEETKPPAREPAPSRSPSAANADGPITNIGEAFAHARRWTDDELTSVADEATNIIRNDKVLGLDFQNQPILDALAKSSSLTEALRQTKPFTAYCRAWTDPASAGRLNASPPPRDSAYGAYLSISVAAAEASIGNVESAVQLLDRQIALQRSLVQRIDDSCKAGFPKNLNLLRARLALVRLENVQIDFAGQQFFSLGSDADSALGFSLLSRLTSAIQDVETILRSRGDGSFEPILLYAKLDAAGAIGKSAAASCPPPATVELSETQVSTRYVAASLAYLDLKLRNYVVSIVAQHPSLARAFPDRLDEFAKDADLLENFDFDCLTSAGYPLGLRIPAYVQHSIGQFRELQAADFGATPKDPELPGEDRATPRATLLCKAYVAYSKAKHLFRLALRPDNAPTTGTEASDLPFAKPPHAVPDAILRRALEELLTRSRTELYSFPANAVEKAQTAVKDCDREPDSDQ